MVLEAGMVEARARRRGGGEDGITIRRVHGGYSRPADVGGECLCMRDCSRYQTDTSPCLSVLDCGRRGEEKQPRSEGLKVEGEGGEKGEGE